MASGFLFFAYGDMADETRMAQADPLSDLMGNAKAPDQRFTFNTGGYPNIKPEAGASTWGTLWMVPASAMERLDAEARERGLERGVVSIICPAGPKVPATVYSNPTAESGQPLPEMLAGAVVAAEAMKLDRRFRRELGTWRVES